VTDVGKMLLVSIKPPYLHEHTALPELKAIKITCYHLKCKIFASLKIRVISAFGLYIEFL
jgi:hypothetical protein